MYALPAGWTLPPSPPCAPPTPADAPVVESAPDTPAPCSPLWPSPHQAAPCPSAHESSLTRPRPPPVPPLLPSWKEGEGKVGTLGTCQFNLLACLARPAASLPPPCISCVSPPPPCQEPCASRDSAQHVVGTEACGMNEQTNGSKREKSWSGRRVEGQWDTALGPEVQGWPCLPGAPLCSAGLCHLEHWAWSPGAGRTWPPLPFFCSLAQSAPLEESVPVFVTGAVSPRVHQ